MKFKLMIPKTLKLNNFFNIAITLSIIVYLLIKINLLKLPKKSLRVLMFHNISDIKNFEKQINLLKKDWKLINPDRFFRIIQGKEKVKGR